MVDRETVCCMCGDVGFPDKLFRCSKCHNRSQHSYCSNYYSESAEPIGVCDWCQCEEKKSSSSSRHGHSSYSSPRNNYNNTNNNNNNNYNKMGHANEVRSAYRGEKIKQHHHREEGGSSAEKAAGKSPSPRTAPRRYKLLKDVIC